MNRQSGKRGRAGTIVFLWGVLWLLLALAAARPGQEAWAAGGGPDHEQRSCIQSADGYAYLSEDMTLAQTRAAALANAKRQAIEMARTYIQSKTKIQNFVLQSDLVESAAEGSVKILEQKDFGVQDNTRYHIWIKAEVVYGMGAAGADIPSGFDPDPRAPLSVKVWTSQKHYHAGDRIEIFVRGNRRFYARIVDIDQEGRIIQLLPNDFRRLNRFEPGKVYKIPDEGDRFDLKVTAPYGQDQIVVYACEAPLGPVDMQPLGGGLHLFRGSRESLAVQTRGIAVVKDSVGANDGIQFYEASWSVTTAE